MMIHNPWGTFKGEANDLRHGADVLDEVKQTIINAYQLKTNKSRLKISQMMDEETWMSAKKAVSEGFADGMLYSDSEEEQPVVVVDNVDRFWGHEETGADISRLVLTRLGYNQELINKVVTIIKFHDHKTFATIESVEDTINLVGNDLVSYLFQLQRADLLSHSEKYYKVLLPKLNAAIKIYEQNFDAFNKENKQIVDNI